jgi:hypothetical protein
MKTIYINGIEVRLFKNGLVKVMTTDQLRSILILAYMNDEGMLEDKFFESLA